MLIDEGALRCNRLGCCCLWLLLFDDLVVDIIEEELDWDF